MKKIIIAFSVSVLLAVSIFSCKKNTEDPNLSYIKGFYGVNVVHSFVCLNPTNDQKSLKVDLVWNEQGVASYTTTEIPRDTINEHNSRIFMPSSQFNADNGTITPTKKVKTKMLVYQNGNFEPVENYNCNGIWTWSCQFCNWGEAHLLTSGSNSWVICGSITPPYCYATWHCIQEYQPLIGWQTE